MRISDWSSDVCSSDLPVVQLRGGFRARVSQQRAGGHALGIGVVGFGVDVGQPQVVAGVAHQAVVAAVAEGALDLETLRQGQVALIAIRSEEHTSELQSLMRISYAVFCLKKKQKNNKRDT